MKLEIRIIYESSEEEKKMLFLFVHFSFSGFLFTQQHAQDNSHRYSWCFIWLNLQIAQRMPLKKLNHFEIQPSRCRYFARLQRGPFCRSKVLFFVMKHQFEPNAVCLLLGN